MSAERLPSRPRTQEALGEEAPLYRRIDDLLDQFPPELRERWEEEIEGVADADAVEVLRSALEKRNEARGVPLTDLSESNITAEQRETVLHLKEAILSSGAELGRGNVATVFADPSNPRHCYKVIRDRTQYALCNNIMKEGRFLEELRGFSHAGVRTPQAYATMSLPEFTALGMERLPGMSLEQLHSLQELPASFDRKRYFAAMRSFLEEMLEKHRIYHRDLRLANMMFDPETGTPFLIDFGRAVHAYETQDGFLEFTLQGKTVRAQNGNERSIQYLEKQFQEKFG